MSPIPSNQVGNVVPVDAAVLSDMETRCSLSKSKTTCRQIHPTRETREFNDSSMALTASTPPQIEAGERVNLEQVSEASSEECREHVLEFQIGLLVFNKRQDWLANHLNQSAWN